jgi:hypothetical protein
MADYQRIRDSVHERFLARGLCYREYSLFLRSRDSAEQLIGQLNRNMQFMLEENCISESELVSLIDDPTYDLSISYPEVFAWAVKTCREGFLDWFLSRADVAQYFPDALHWAAKEGLTGILEILIRHGASVRDEDSSPLRYAAANGQVKAVEVLLAAGADPSARGFEAQRLARLGGHDSAAALVAKPVAR